MQYGEEKMNKSEGGRLVDLKENISIFLNIVLYHEQRRIKQDSIIIRKEGDIIHIFCHKSGKYSHISLPFDKITATHFTSKFLSIFVRVVCNGSQ